MRTYASPWFALLALLVTLEAFADVVERKVTIHSEGTRISGIVLQPSGPQEHKLPAVIMSHGWGGTAAMLRPQAERFAQAGYFVLIVDYRGWGDSDARWVRDETAPAGSDARRELREVVHPLDQATDLFNAVHWAMGEIMVDQDRVGLWGTSFSGGLVAYVAAREPRIRAIVSQVAWFGAPLDKQAGEALQRSRAAATRRARGEIGYPPPGAREIGNLRGGPVAEGFLRYAPIDDIPRMKGCAMLVIDVENEELFDIREHGELAFQRAPGPRKRVVIPGLKHYDIYGVAREEATGLAVEWMDQHLKAAR